MPDPTRAPAALWPALRDLLAGMEVGEEGVLRADVTPRPSREIISWDQSAEPGEIVTYRGWPCRLVESRGRNKAAAGELTPQRLTPLLRPGRYWVPETWRVRERDSTCGWTAIEHAENEGRVTKMPFVAPSWMMRDGWNPPRRMPIFAARLFCEVGEVGVEEWCEPCEGGGYLPFNEVGCPDESQVCSDCNGSPPPHWRWRVKRIAINEGSTE